MSKSLQKWKNVKTDVKSTVVKKTKKHVKIAFQKNYNNS